MFSFFFLSVPGGRSLCFLLFESLTDSERKIILLYSSLTSMFGSKLACGLYSSSIDSSTYVLHNVFGLDPSPRSNWSTLHFLHIAHYFPYVSTINFAGRSNAHHRVHKHFFIILMLRKNVHFQIRSGHKFTLTVFAAVNECIRLVQEQKVDWWKIKHISMQNS